jgi:hypothetical protein
MKLPMILLVLASSLAAQHAPKDDKYDSVGFLNGRDWNGMTEELKVGFVMGFKNGLIWGAFISESAKQPKGADATISGAALAEFVKPYNVRQLSNGEIMQAIDAFYSDPTNLNIALPSAMYYIRRKVEGLDPEGLRKLETELRQGANTHQ